MRSLALVAFVLIGCASSSPKGSPAAPPPASAERTLYERLGGRDAITLVVDRFVARTSSDPRISARFVNIDIPHIKAAMVEHISEATGGPVKYTGKDMRVAHTGMNIDDAEFAAFMEDLALTLDEVEVPAREKGEVLAFFESLKADTVRR